MAGREARGGPPPEGRVFLTAQWRHVAMLNFEIEPAVLRPFVPAGTELDSWRGRTFVSVVGFLFLDTRVLGVAIPYHQDFEEVNLRFYVRRHAGDQWRRGVVFVKEIVPRAAIALTARWLYGENYVALRMRHDIQGGQAGGRLSYSWWLRGRENRLAMSVAGDPHEISDGSEEEFITEHYWGYARQGEHQTREYRVEHPRWRVTSAASAQLGCDVAELYGPQFVDCLTRPPASAFLAEGSDVTVYRGVPVTR